jgi:hypothetical protein
MVGTMKGKRSKVSSAKVRAEDRGEGLSAHVSDPAHARTEVDAIVQHIARLMTSGRWRTGHSHTLLAKKYELSTSTIATYATQASRLIRMSLGNGDEIRTRLVVMLEDIHRRALKKQAATGEGELYDAPDLKSAVSAITEQAKLLGLVESTKTELSVNVNVQSYAALDDNAMLEKVEAQIARLTEVRARLLMKQSIPALPVTTEKEHEQG